MNDIDKQILNKKIFAVLTKIAIPKIDNLSEYVETISIKNNLLNIIINTKDNDLGNLNLLKQTIETKINKKLNLKTLGIESANVILTQQSNKSQINKTTKHKIKYAKQIFFVASGKGGVGKSTISSIIAQNFATSGLTVGIIDADFHGPSISRIFGIKQKPEIKDNMIIPPISHGVKLMSMGMLIDENSAASLRGPMLSKMLAQFLVNVDWGNLDVLVIDLPPGTGDVHLSLMQNYDMSNAMAVMVTTPQILSAIDVERAIDFYQKFSVNFAGIIENMSFYEDENNKKHFIFPGNVGEIIAKKYGIKNFFQIPIKPKISEYCDGGLALNDLLSSVDFKKLLY